MNVSAYSKEGINIKKKPPQNYNSQPNPGVTSPSQVVMWSSVKKYQQR